MQDALREPEEIAQQEREMDLEDELAPRRRPKLRALEAARRGARARCFAGCIAYWLC